MSQFDGFRPLAIFKAGVGTFQDLGDVRKEIKNHPGSSPYHPAAAMGHLWCHTPVGSGRAGQGRGGRWAASKGVTTNAQRTLRGSCPGKTLQGCPSEAEMLALCAVIPPLPHTDWSPDAGCPGRADLVGGWTSGKAPPFSQGQGLEGTQLRAVGSTQPAVGKCILQSWMKGLDITASAICTAPFSLFYPHVLPPLEILVIFKCSFIDG